MEIHLPSLCDIKKKKHRTAKGMRGNVETWVVAGTSTSEQHPSWNVQKKCSMEYASHEYSMTDDFFHLTVISIIKGQFMK